MKQIFFALTLSMLTAAVLQTETAHAQSISCPSSSSCTLGGLPNYNQNSSGLLATSWDVGGRTNLGSPAAASDLLTAIINSGKVVKAGTATASFKPRSADSKILYLAGLMATNKSTGTVTSKLASVLAARKSDFNPVLNSATAYNSTSAGISPAVMLANMKVKRAGLFTYGNYAMTCTVLSSGSRRCTYARSGGVVVAIKTVNGANVNVVDPYGAAAKTYNIALIPKTSSDGKPLVHVLPASFSTSTCYVLDKTSRFVEHFSGLGR